MLTLSNALYVSFFARHSLLVILSVSLSLSVFLSLSLSLSFSLFRHLPRNLFCLFKFASYLHPVEIYDRSCITHISLFMGIFDRIIGVKSLQSFHISFFSLSLFLSLCISLFSSLILRIYGCFCPCYCISLYYVGKGVISCFVFEG